MQRTRPNPCGFTSCTSLVLLADRCAFICIYFPFSPTFFLLLFLWLRTDSYQNYFHFRSRSWLSLGLSTKLFFFIVFVFRIVVFSLCWSDNWARFLHNGANIYSFVGYAFWSVLSLLTTLCSSHVFYCHSVFLTYIPYLHMCVYVQVCICVTYPFPFGSKQNGNYSLICVSWVLYCFLRGCCS